MLNGREIMLAFMGAAGLALGGCGEHGAEHADEHGGEAHEHAPGETHEGADDHGHEHDAAAEHDLGSATIGAHTVRAVRYGELTPGEESDVDITVSGDAAGAPAAVRVWIGVEDGSGSMKSRAESEGDHFHAHVEAPDPMPEGAMLWVEIEGADGQTAAGSFALG